MACMYIRVPHYVASFWRNREERNPIAIGGHIDVSGEYVLWQLLQQGLVRNPNEDVVKEGCFCERMWRKMLRGQGLVANDKGRYVKVFPGRDTEIYLTDAEVRKMAGMKSVQNDEQNEYLCVDLPRRVWDNSLQYVVDGQWQLKGKTAQAFIAELKKSFWDECILYIEQFVKSGGSGFERSTNEGLDRFMLRYDIRVGQDNKERLTLKRNYYRQLQRKNNLHQNFEEFGVVE